MLYQKCQVLKTVFMKIQAFCYTMLSLFLNKVCSPLSRVNVNVRRG